MLRRVTFSFARGFLVPSACARYSRLPILRAELGKAVAYPCFSFLLGGTRSVTNKKRRLRRMKKKEALRKLFPFEEYVGDLCVYDPADPKTWPKSIGATISSQLKEHRTVTETLPDGRTQVFRLVSVRDLPLGIKHPQFLCPLCLRVATNQETYDAHINGRQHQGNLKILEKLRVQRAKREALAAAQAGSSTTTAFPSTQPATQSATASPPS